MGETTLRGLRKVRMVTERIGHDILWVRRADSTNNLAWREAEQNCHDGMVVLAEEQTAGRGRLGRSWVCPPGKGILVSIVLRPERPMDASPYLTVCGSLAVRDVAAALTGLPAVIRWPNDVLLQDRKIAGVLVESKSLPGAGPSTFVLGIGLNVGQQAADFPDAIRNEATSLDLASHRRIDRLQAAQQLMEALDHWYDRLLGGRTEDLSTAWRDASAILRRRVDVRVAGEVHRGVVEDLDPCEGVFLRLDRGGILRLRGEHVEQVRLVEER